MQRMPTELIHDNRGLAMGIIGFVAIIVTFAILYTMFNAGADLIFTTSQSQTSATAATDAINERQTIWTNLPVYGLFLAMVFLLSRAVFETRAR